LKILQLLSVYNIIWQWWSFGHHQSVVHTGGVEGSFTTDQCCSLSVTSVWSPPVSSYRRQLWSIDQHWFNSYPLMITTTSPLVAWAGVYDLHWWNDIASMFSYLWKSLANLLKYCVLYISCSASNNLMDLYYVDTTFAST
jgi:hypothetical protein